MYKDTNKVLINIKDHFRKIFDENFDMNIKHRYVDFTSKSYLFRVHVNFIQARIKADFEVPIEKRIDDSLNGQKITPDKMYKFTTKFVEKPLSSEYCIELMEK